MKIVQKDNHVFDRTDESAEVAPLLKEKKLIARIQDRKQAVWELDLLTGEIDKPKVESVSDLEGNAKRSVVTRDKALYCQALNLKNAEKHFSRQIRNIVGKNYGMWCTDTEWAQFSFAQRVKLIKTLMGFGN